MAYDPSDATTARALLEAAIAWETAPELEVEQVDMLFALASSLDEDGNTVYLSKDLNKAAAKAWNIKAGLASGMYSKLRAASGAELVRDQDYFLRMAQAYATGAMSVTGESTSRGGINSVGLMTSTSVDYWETQA